jgi:hypothetical protein
VDEDEILLTCPCCSSQLRIDDVGELEVVERHYEEGEHAGIRGVTTVEANPGWKQYNYNYNQQQSGKYKAPEHMILGKAGAAVEPDPEIEAVNNADLRKRNLI